MDRCVHTTYCGSQACVLPLSPTAQCFAGLHIPGQSVYCVAAQLTEHGMAWNSILEEHNKAYSRSTTKHNTQHSVANHGEFTGAASLHRSHHSPRHRNIATLQNRGKRNQLVDINEGFRRIFRSHSLTVSHCVTAFVRSFVRSFVCSLRLF